MKIHQKINKVIKSYIERIKIIFSKENFEVILKYARNYFTAKFELIDGDERIYDATLDEKNRPINKANTLFFLIILVVITFAIWGSIAKIDSSISAEGQVTPDSKIQMIQSIITGKLEKIHVTEGTTVNKDQPLFSIDAVEIIAEKDKSENLYYSTLAKVARLRAEAGLDESPIFSKELIENRPEYVEIENQIYKFNQEGLEISQRQLQMSEELFEQGAESESGLLTRKQQFLERKNQILLELSSAEGLLAETKAVLPGQRLRAEQAIIKSPLDGTITNVNVTTIGEVIDAGFKLAEVVPDDENLIVEARVKPEDVSFVQKGMKAYVALTSYDQSVYGRMKGIVEKISANTRTDQNGQIYYTATLSANFNEFSEEVGGPIQAGMVIQASIVGDKRTVLGYIFSPVTKLKSKAFREK
tara:strand:- start:547 stop:1794 length:1248 start_codon:yes stop_codon:yes gene_type:complete